MTDPVSVICIGGAAVDRKYRAAEHLIPETSNPVRGVTAFGGVARNIAETLAKLGVEAALISAVGDDHDGRALLAHLRSAGVDCDRIVQGPGPTAGYIAALNPDGSLALALADMAIFDSLTADRIGDLGPAADRAAWLFADCNLPGETLHHVIELAARSACSLAVDGVSVAKAARLPGDLTGVDLLFVNEDEALGIAGDAGPAPEDTGKALHGRGAGTVVVTLGAAGCMACGSDGIQRVPTAELPMADATGAGDALIAGTLAGLVRGKSLKDALTDGTKLAARALASRESVPAP